MKTALVVDNPYRDLPGMVLTALRLCRRGVTCYLVPFNIVHHELWRIVPDFVLLNYLRPNMETLYRDLADREIPFGILDTEGGVVSSVEKIGQSLVQDREIREAVRCYCCWGSTQKDHLVDDGYFSGNQVVVTGTPKMDFYAPSLRHVTLKKSEYIEHLSEKFVLVNGTFPLGNPGFQTPEQEHELMVSLGWDSEEAARIQREQIEGLRLLTGLTNHLARRFPEADFVYRPHPFERKETCEELLETLENLYCIRKGTADGWILRAQAVIQSNCSTALEAAMAGVPALCPDWIPRSVPMPSSNAVSLHYETEEDLASHLEDILDGRFRCPPRLEERRDRIIGDWFHKVDGLSSERVARAILNHLSPSGADGRRKSCRDLLFRDGRSNPVKRARDLLRKAVGFPPKHLYRIERQRKAMAGDLERWERTGKSFDAASVRALVDLVRTRLDREEGEAPREADVRRAETGRDYCFELGDGKSIVVGPAPD